MPVSRGGMYSAFADVERKDAKPLDGVHEVNDAAIMADLPDGFDVCTVAAQELHVADSEQTRALRRLVDLFKWIGDREPLDSYTPVCQALPWILIRGELFFKGDNLIAAPPIQPHGDCGDAFGCVLS